MSKKPKPKQTMVEPAPQAEIVPEVLVSVTGKRGSTGIDRVVRIMEVDGHGNVSVVWESRPLPTLEALSLAERSVRGYVIDGWTPGEFFEARPHG